MTYTGLFLILIGTVITISGFIAAFLGEKENKKLNEKIDQIKSKWNK